ncbi:MAG: discoidin domain-containing protein [Magnetococcales bacterium]|nr:discoidin domain-containing protein [Magnetococcales bacterium]
MSGHTEWQLKFSNPQMWTHGFVVRTARMAESFEGEDISNSAIQTGDPSNTTAQYAFDDYNSTTWNGFENYDIAYATLRCVWSLDKDINHIVVSFGLGYPVVQIDLQYWEDAWITKKTWTLYDVLNGSYYALSATEAIFDLVMPYSIMHTVECDLEMKYRFDPVVSDLVMPYSIMHKAECDLEMPSDIDSFVAGGTYRYWRLYITKTTSGSSMLVSPYEMEMRATVDGSDQCNGGTASASHADADAYKLFDNNLSNYWNNGSPGGSNTWIKYDFGTEISVGEIAILPRYQSQMPEDFTIQASNDALSWIDVQEWSGVTDWQGGIWKNFTVATPIITAISDLEMPWSIMTYPQFDLVMPYTIGEFVNADLVMPYTIWHGAVVDLEMPYSNGLVYADLSMSYGIDIGMSLSFTQHYTAARSLVMPYGFMITTSTSLVMPYGRSSGSCASLVMPYCILTHNNACASLVMPYRIIESDAPLIITPIDPHILHGGERIDVVSVEIGLAEGDYSWGGTANLADQAGFRSLRVDDPVTLVIGDTAFSVVVDSRSISNGAMSISMVSSTATLATPRASPVDLVISGTITASEAAKQAVGGAIEWNLVDWPIPSGRIGFHDTTPLEIARSIADAAGGVVESMPDGSLRARHRFPVRVPDWNVADPDHVWTEDVILSIHESYRHLTRIDRVVVRDWQPTSSGRLSIEPDTRQRGLNHGAPSYRPGSHVHLLVHASPDVRDITLRASAGELWPGNPQTWLETFDLVFSDSSGVALPKQVYSLEAWVWLGTDLGSLVLSSDGSMVTADLSGLSVARVVVVMRAQSWKLIVPDTLSGEAKFPVALIATAVDGDAVSAGEITAIRGDGLHQGADILEPLASHVDARRERGRAEIDSGEPLQNVVLTGILDVSILPGDLLEVREETTWRGKVKSVRHTIGDTAITTIDMVRYVSY